MLKPETVSKLLNRSLTSAETENFKLYLKIAMQRLEELLCMDLCGDQDERTYETRYGYRTVYIDPFTEVTSIKIDGETVSADKYTVKQNDKYNGSWFNVIEFDTKRRGENITVDAAWGFGSCPADLQVLLARLFAQGSTEQKSDNQVKSKKIEDFSVTFKDGATYDEFVLANAAIIDKYSHCNVGAIRNGSVNRSYDDLRSLRNY